MFGQRATAMVSACSRLRSGRHCSCSWVEIASAAPPIATNPCSSPTDPSKVSRYNWSLPSSAPTSATMISTSLRLLGLGEDSSECLGVSVGQTSTGHVGAVVAAAAQVGVPDSGDAQILELVVLADRGERDPVVDLTDLVQSPRRVLRDEQDSLVVLSDDH